MRVKYLLLFLLLYRGVYGWGQTSIEGYIIDIEKELIYIDLNGESTNTREKVDVYANEEETIKSLIHFYYDTKAILRVMFPFVM